MPFFTAFCYISLHNKLVDKVEHKHTYSSKKDSVKLKCRKFTSSQTNTIRGISFANHQISISGSKLEPKVLTYGQLCFKLGERKNIEISSSNMEEHYQSFIHTGGSSRHSNDSTECVESRSIENESSDCKNSSAVGEALIELMLQPHQVQTGGGGGDSDNRGWRDDDRDKDNNKNRTYKRRR